MRALEIREQLRYRRTGRRQAGGTRRIGAKRRSNPDCIHVRLRFIDELRSDTVRN